MPKLESKRDVVVVDYDPNWPRRFEAEKARIEAALGGIAVVVEHVGSTAVPGLFAKPIIDIMVGLRRLADGERCVAPLDALGYEFRGDGGIPDHCFFRKGQPRTHHVHMVEHGSAFWNDHVSFRDRLRASPDLARRYGELKKRLAVEYRTRREEYTEAKTPFIEAVLADNRPLAKNRPLAEDRPEARASG